MRKPSNFILEQQSVLNEIFDSGFDTEELHVTNDERHMLSKVAGLHDFREYHLKDGSTKEAPSKLQIFKRDGAYEIHHVHHSGESGKILDGSTTGNRVIGAILRHADEKIKQNYPVRIAAPTDSNLLSHYHRIAKTLARRHGLVISSVTKMEPSFDYDGDRSSFTLSRSKQKEPIVEAIFSWFKDSTGTRITSQGLL